MPRARSLPPPDASGRATSAAVRGRFALILPPPDARGSAEHCGKAPPTSGRPASGSLSGKRPAPASGEHCVDVSTVAGALFTKAPPPKKAPPQLPPCWMRPSSFPERSHDGFVRFLYMSGSPVQHHSRRLPVVISCNFKHRWFEVLAAARLEAGLPLFLSSPVARGTDHVLASASRTREVYASIVLMPPGPPMPPPPPKKAPPPLPPWL